MSTIFDVSRRVAESMSLRIDYAAAARARERQKMLEGITLADGPRDATEARKQVRRRLYRRKREHAGTRATAPGLDAVLATETPELGIGYGGKHTGGWQSRGRGVALTKLSIEEPA